MADFCNCEPSAIRIDHFSTFLHTVSVWIDYHIDNMKDNIFTVSPWNIQLRFFPSVLFCLHHLSRTPSKKRSCVPSSSRSCWKSNGPIWVAGGLIPKMDRLRLIPQKLWILSHGMGSLLSCHIAVHSMAHDVFFSLTEFHCRQFRSELILYLFYLISWAVWCMAGRDSCPPPPTLADDLRSVAGGSLWLSEGS